MPSSQAARRYARALFELANEEGQTDAIRGELQGLRGLLDQSRELREAVLTPLRPAAERKGVVRAIAERGAVSGTVVHFLSLLIDQRRLLDFTGIQEEYERLANEASGLLTAAVTSAAPLDSERQERLRSALAARTGRQIQLDVSVDPSLIGGVIAKVGDTLYDGSVRTQLEQLQHNLSKEA